MSYVNIIIIASCFILLLLVTLSLISTIVYNKNKKVIVEYEPCKACEPCKETDAYQV